MEEKNKEEMVLDKVFDEKTPPPFIVTNVSLPLDQKELSDIWKDIPNMHFDIDVRQSLKNFTDDYHKMLIYMSNCGIRHSYLSNFRYDEDLENLMIEYIKLDRFLPIQALNELWLYAINDNEKSLDENTQKFIEKFRLNHQDYIEEVKDFYYSLLIVLGELIDDNNEELKTMIKQSEKVSLQKCSYNIVAICEALNFFPFLAKLERPRMLFFSEFTSNVLDGLSLSYFFIHYPTPFQAMYLYNMAIKDPEMVQKVLDNTVNKHLLEKGE